MGIESVRRAKKFWANNQSHSERPAPSIVVYGEEMITHVRNLGEYIRAHQGEIVSNISAQKPSGLEDFPIHAILEIINCARQVGFSGRNRRFDPPTKDVCDRCPLNEVCSARVK